MSLDILAYSLQKKGALEDYPFGPSPLVIKVGGKIFAFFMKGEKALHISLKCDPVIAANLREQHEAVRPGYHLNKKHWNTVVLDGSLPQSDIQAMVDHSYDLVVRSLPKAVRLALTEEGTAG